jgi:hypothetical protein
MRGKAIPASIHKYGTSCLHIVSLHIKPVREKKKQTAIKMRTAISANPLQLDVGSHRKCLTICFFLTMGTFQYGEYHLGLLRIILTCPQVLTMHLSEVFSRQYCTFHVEPLC